MREGGVLKTTVELPDTLFRQTKAAAALRGESIKDFVTAALRAHLASQATGVLEERGWRNVFGKASAEEVEEIGRVVAEELERIDLDTWR
jgi:Arc/MetJ family transcription regulator